MPLRFAPFATLLLESYADKRGLLGNEWLSRHDSPTAPQHAVCWLLRHHRLEVVAIQVSAREEVAPDLRGDVELRDVETGETRELTVSPAVLAAYQQRHQTLLRDLEGFCRERAIPCFTVVSDQPFDAVVLRMFRAGGLLR